MQPPMIKVKATVNLSDLPAGSRALVNAQNPYIQSLLKGLFLIPVKP